jgi:hypothetical protein
MQEDTAASPSVQEDYPSLSLEEHEAPVNLKEVFGQDKRTKEGYKAKSKSKLRGRVQIKRSELLAEAQEE